MNILRVTIVSILIFTVEPSAEAQNLNDYPIKEFLEVTTFTQLSVSPDGSYLAFITKSNDFEEDKQVKTIWRIDLRDGSYELVRLTSLIANYSNLQWSPDGRFLSFVSNRTPAKGNQLFVMNMAGGDPMIVTKKEMLKGGISAYDWTPSGKALVVAVRDNKTEAEIKALEDFYGDGKRLTNKGYTSTIYSVPLPYDSEGSLEEIFKFNGTVEDLNIAPDGNKMVFLSGARTDYIESFRDYEVYSISFLNKSKLTRLTENQLIEWSPQWSSDSKSIFINREGVPGVEWTTYSQKDLYIINYASGKMTLMTDFEGHVESHQTEASDGVIFRGTTSTESNLYLFSRETSSVSQLTKTEGLISTFSASQAGTLVAYAMSDSKSFPEIYIMSGEDGYGEGPRKITSFNASIDQQDKPELEIVSWQNGDGEMIEGVLYWPPGKKHKKNLPFIVDIHGGPSKMQSKSLLPTNSVSLYYPSLLASRGYLVLEPNYRGSTGRDDEFHRSIVGHYNSRPANDILTGVDYLVQKKWADQNRLGIIGYSNGGVLTNYIIGRTDRFKAAVSGAGVWNELSAFSTTILSDFDDQLFNGKAPWEDRDRYWNESAISNAGNITTPTLFTHGESDPIVPPSQGYEAYRALTRLGVDTELILFPEEGHGFSKPSRKLSKLKAEIEWLDHYILGKERSN
jgi:dipeptidyl aminopeptidase/acylaminoacyl peptidase